MEVDVVLQAKHIGKQEATCKTKRHGQNHHNGDEDTLIECAQDEVDEHHAYHKDDGRGATSRGLLTRHTAKLIAIACGQHIGRNLPHSLDGLTRGVAVGCLTIDRNGREEVKPRNRLRAIDTCEGYILADGRHLACRVAHKHIVHSLRVEPALGRSLHHNPIEFRKTVHIGSIGATHIARHNAQHITGRHAVTLTPCSIYLQQVLRILGVKRGACPTNFRSLIEFHNEVVGDGFEVLNGTTLLVLHIEFKATTCAIAGNHTAREDHNLSRGNVSRGGIDLLNHRVDVIALFGTLCPVVQPDVETTARRAHTTHHTETGGVGVGLNLLNGIQAVGYLLHNPHRFAQVGTRRCLHVNVDGAHIFLGHKTRLGGAHHIEQATHRCNHQQPSQPAAAEHKKHTLLVAVHKSLEARIKSHVEASREAHLAILAHRVGLHQQGTQRRAQGH